MDFSFFKEGFFPGGCTRGGERSGFKPLLWGELAASASVGGTFPGPGVPLVGRMRKGVNQ